MTILKNAVSIGLMVVVVWLLLGAAPHSLATTLGLAVSSGGLILLALVG